MEILKSDLPEENVFYSIDELKEFLGTVPEGQFVRVTVEFEDDVVYKATGVAGDGGKEEITESE